MALFRQTVRSPSLAPILEEAAALPGKEARDFLTGKLPDLAPEVRRVISTYPVRKLPHLARVPLDLVPVVYLALTCRLSPQAPPS